MQVLLLFENLEMILNNQFSFSRLADAQKCPEHSKNNEKIQAEGTACADTPPHTSSGP